MSRPERDNMGCLAGETFAVSLNWFGPVAGVLWMPFVLDLVRYRREGGEMMPTEANDPLGVFEVGVALVVARESPTRPSDRDSQDGGEDLPGYDEASWLSKGRHATDQVVEKGGEAVQAATDAIAEQIGLAAQRIATAIEAQAIAAPGPGKLGLESVEVSFGITLSVGVQALFTAQTESSAQVSIVLARRPAADD
jgi:hypothetical protein